MSHDGLFFRRIEKNQMIRPFLVAGALEKDYVGDRTNKGFTQGLESAFTREATQAFYANPDFREMDTFTVAGMQGQWHFSRVFAPQYAAGHYFVMEKVAVLPIYTVLESDVAQTVKIRFNARRCMAWLNGQVILNNEDIHQRKRERTYVFEHVKRPAFEDVEVALGAGQNRLIVMQGAVGRGTGMSFSMELLECEAPITARIPMGIDAARREEIAHSQLETYMTDDSWRLGETPVLHVGRVPLEGCTVYAQLLKRAGRPLDGGTPMGEEWAIAQEETALPSDLPVGEYLVRVRWELADGTPLDVQQQDFCVLAVREPMPGYGNLSLRRQLMTEKLAERGDALALYKLGAYDRMPREAIFAACDKIERRADCADFELLPLLWLVWEDQHARHIDQDIHDRIREAALSFRYWVDEPGTSSMFYCSENHRVGFHVCEYLAGLVYPSDMFTNCGQNGMYHSLKGRMHLMEWLDQRCRAGFDEPLSDSYLPITLSALLVLREVLPMEEYPLRNMVNILLDFMVYIFAVSSFDGVMATPRGRSYNRPLRSGLMSGIGGMFWLLFGNGQANAASLPSELAFSPYVPPEGICALAENFTPATFSYKQGIMHFDKHNADFTIRRTPDYAIGGTRDHNVGMCDMHFISAMITLRGDAMVFFSAPNNMGEGSGMRPDYWAGQAFLPRVLMTGRTLAIIWHEVDDPNIWMTHCHLNPRKFDEVVQRDGWTFARKGDGYLAIYSTVPHAFSTEGNYAGRELVCPGREVVWLAECGSLSEDGGFDAFIVRILSAARWQDARGMHFDSPGSGLIEFGLKEGFTVDRQDVPIEPYMALSPYLRSRYGSGRFEYTCPGYTLTQWSYPATE